MTADDIIKLAKETREAQKSYFKTRSQGDLSLSKQLERSLDKAIDEYFEPVSQMDLFGQKESGENPRPVCGSIVD